MKTMRETLIDALTAHYQGQAQIHYANISVYLENPTGIGEHPDITGAIDEELEKLASADEKLEVLNKYFVSGKS